MSWESIYAITLPVIYIFVIVALVRSNRQMNRLAKEAIEHGSNLLLDNIRLTSVCRALALRVSPRGHVDLSIEEVEAEGEVRIFKEETEVRVLVK